MKKFNPSTLPYFAALVQASLFAFAGVAYFGPWGWIPGLGVGAVVSLSVAVASSRISEISAKRQPLARLALTVMLVLSPATISLSFFVPKSVWTAIAWGASPDIAILLAGVISGRGLVAQDEKPLKPADQPARSRSAKPKRRSARPSKSLSEISCRYAAAGCYRTFAHQNAANAHARTCDFKPTVIALGDMAARDKK